MLRLFGRMPAQAQHPTPSTGTGVISVPRWRRIARVVAWRISRRSGGRKAFLFSIAPVAAAILVAAGSYIHFSRVIDQRLRQNPFEDSTNVYGSPLIFSIDDPVSAEQIQSELNLAGYHRDSGGRPGTWQSSGPQSIIVVPPDGSSQRRVSIAIDHGIVTSIETPKSKLGRLNLGYPLLTTVNASRERRRLVTFSGIPTVLVHAIISAEDKHFFQHGGLDLPRVLKAAWVDFRHGRKAQGASTLTMQLVRGLWLEPDKRWSRKLAEAMMTIHLEHIWTKQKILETYANQVFLGRQAAYNIRGFGEASRVLFGKPLRDITLPEAALLAGMVQRPSYLNPFRNPERAKERRNLVLSLMRDNACISESQYAQAISAPLLLSSHPQIDAAAAPYFLDLVNDELQNKESQPARAVYTTIDINLQRAADAAIANGMKLVDKQLARKERDGARPEAALIALDPHTGAIKALVGGRDYARSQLNRILARRPPGSVFKPFVYAAALNTALTGGDEILTPASTVDDEPGAFWFNGEAYEPANFRHEIFGVLTLRDALAKSDNVAAVRVAEAIGYRTVAALARRCGLKGVQATPAIALGAYDASPLEIAGAYTVFANGGLRAQPSLISSMETETGEEPHKQTRPGSDQALDPRVAWLMDNMLEEVLRSGTAAGVRARGFALPAAGKTGTSHDGWFAGFTSQLLCVVWVGFDDYRELGLEGAKSALPIWTEFMKQASKFGPYRNAREFSRPAGIESQRICTESGKLEGDFCDETRVEYFMDGTAPDEKCGIHSVAPAQQTAMGGYDGNVPTIAPSAAGNSDPARY